MFLENAQGFKQQVAEVAGVHHLQALLVFGIELAAQAIGERIGFAGRNPVWRQATIFPAVDQIGQLAGGPALLVDVVGGKQLLHQANLVVGIENGKARTQSRQFGVVPQDFYPDGMEGAEPGQALDHAADQRADAVFHFARRLVGEGDGEKLAGPGLARGQNMGEPGGQHPGLAGASPRQNQQRAIGDLDGGALFGVKALEIGRFALRHGALRQAPRLHQWRRAVIVEITQVDGLDGHGFSESSGPI